MPATIDKVIIANRAALRGKYRPAGATRIEKALAGLIAADAAKGLATRIVYIDEAAQMRPFGVPPVTGPADEKGAKGAVDAIDEKLTPDYVVLLDGPDVVPHITLNAIAGLVEDDEKVPSDLPYASDAPWSQDAHDFLTVTRVVGRLPAAAAETSPDTIVAIIDRAASHAPSPPADYRDYFSISAEVWQESTKLSLKAVFGESDALAVAPPARHPAIDGDLTRLSHFINCHGATADDRFYGQHGQRKPIAMKSLAIAPNVREGAVVAAECCYGAQLFDYAMAHANPPICMSYMANGAIGYVGSTTIAYGPADSNSEADLITQYFMQQVLKGASLGRAFLEARHQFIRGQVMASPTNLKTIAQFLLLGDPSVQPCIAEPTHTTPKLTEADAKLIDPKGQRRARRLALQSEGAAVAATASRPGKVVAGRDQVSRRVANLAKGHGFEARKVAMVEARGGEILHAAMARLEVDRKVAVVMERREADGAGQTPSIKLLVAHIIGKDIVRIEKLERR